MIAARTNNFRRLADMAALEHCPNCGGQDIINMGGVVANAIFDATGARLYQLPMTPERVRQALSG